jgi:hypothetical protein
MNGFALEGRTFDLGDTPVKPTINRIIRAFCSLTDTRLEDLAGPSKAATISHHRHRLMYLIRQIDPIASYELIGRHLGGRDMATIHEAVAKIATAAEGNPSLALALVRDEDILRRSIRKDVAPRPPPKPWQLLAATQVLGDDKLTDAEARKIALGFLAQIGGSDG